MSFYISYAQSIRKRKAPHIFYLKDDVLCMFSGKEEKVEMVFHNSLIDTVIDKFGKDVFISVVDDHHFKITVPVAVSPQFFAWIFGLGGKVTILGPKSVVKQMKDMLGKVSERYE